MVPITALLLPILVSAVLVFLASFVLHMLLEFWHRPDLDPLPDEDAVMAALRPFAMPPGHNAMPIVKSVSDLKNPAYIEKRRAGPVAFLSVMPNGDYGMGKQLTLWFLFSVFISAFAAYVAGRALGPGASYLEVFRFTGATAFAAYSIGQMQDSIWWNRKWSTTIRAMIDGLIYALLTAGAFGWLWPEM
jgi:hypothetical protein